MTTAERLLDDLADGLRRRIAERRKGEEQLAAFAFDEGPGGGGGPESVEPDWRYFVSRSFAAAGEPGTLDLLERIARGDETVRSLAAQRSPRIDGSLASADRIAGLAAAGLAGRDLETGGVRLTGLGSAVLALAQDVEHRVAASGPAIDRGAP